MRSAFSLAEVVLTIGLSSLLLLGLFLLVRSGTRQFELSSAQVFLSQGSRSALDMTQAFSFSAVMPMVEGAQLIYSPVPNGSELESDYPNCYNLDFVSCCDLLNPELTSQPENCPGYLDRRGGGRFRYRIRFEVAQQRLLLEKLRGDAAPTAPLPDPQFPPRTLATALQQARFWAEGGLIHCQVIEATVAQEGVARGGLSISDQRRSLDAGKEVQQRARRLDIMTSITLPSRTSR